MRIITEQIISKLSVDAEVMRARKAFDEVPKKKKQTDMDELELRIRQDYL